MRTIHHLLVTLFMLAVVCIASPGQPTAEAQSLCPVASPSDLVGCIDAHNEAPTDTPSTINLEADITLSAALPTIVDGNLIIEGNGHSIAVDPGVATVISQQRGTLELSTVELSGASGHAVFVRGGTTRIVGSTLHASNVGFEGRDAEVVMENSTIAENDTVGFLLSGSSNASILQSTIAFNGTIGIQTRRSTRVELRASLVVSNGERACTFGGPQTTYADNGFLGRCGAFNDTRNLAGRYAPSLRDNGCVTAPNCTLTVELFPGSGVADAYRDCGDDSVDQRGFARTRSACDAGAFEAGDFVDSCPADRNFAIDSATDYSTAIRCYNFAPSGTTTTVVVTADFVPRIGFTSETIDNRESPPAKLVIDGDSYTIDGSLFMQRGDFDLMNVGLRKLTVRGANSTARLSNVTTDELPEPSTIALNAEQGASLSLDNVTLANHSIAGVLALSGAQVDVRQSTIVHNTVGIRQRNGTVTITGSLLGSNDVACESVTDAGSFIDGGGNAIDEDGCTGAATPGLNGTYALGVEANDCAAGIDRCLNSVALFAGSPAIDANDQCTSIADVRGFARGGSVCDAGAYERDAAAVATCQGVPVTIDMNQSGVNGIGTPNDDIILGTGGNDVIRGGAGNDLICAGTGNDDVAGGIGDDTIFGDDGNDKIFGNAGADVIHGEDGNDLIHGHRGDDQLYGGDGDDLVFGYADDDFINGGDGRDRLHGNDGADHIVSGRGPGDRIFGNNGPDLLIGGGGRDLILGGDGDDEIFGGGSEDILYGGNGDDLVDGGFLADQISGNAGDDILIGRSGSDELDGGQGTDSCDGGSALDTAIRCEELIDIP